MRLFANSPIWAWIDSFGDKTAIPEADVKSVFYFLWGWGSTKRPYFTNYEFVRGQKSETTSLFMNGVLFIRINWPFGAFIQLRWGDDETKRALLQTGFGYKGNGRLSLMFRIQSDATAESGMDGPNFGQAKGFEYGPH